MQMKLKGLWWETHTQTYQGHMAQRATQHQQLFSVLATL